MHVMVLHSSLEPIKAENKCQIFTNWSFVDHRLTAKALVSCNVHQNSFVFLAFDFLNQDFAKQPLCSVDRTAPPEATPCDLQEGRAAFLLLCSLLSITFQLLYYAYF